MTDNEIISQHLTAIRIHLADQNVILQAILLQLAGTTKALELLIDLRNQARMEEFARAQWNTARMEEIKQCQRMSSSAASADT